MERGKISGLIFLTIAILSLVILASGLSDLRFEPGSRLSFGDALGSPLTFGKLQIRLPSLGYFSVLLSLLFWVALLISVVHFIVSPRARRQVLRNLFRLTAVYIALFLLLRSRSDLLGQLNPEFSTVSAPQMPFSDMLQPGAEPPQWLSLILSMILSALILAIGWRLWHLTRSTDRALDLLVDEARNALGELQGGADWKSTILRCYHQMIRILCERSNVQHRATMTSREFEHNLEGVGMGGEHIHRLSRLFEEARYSPRVPGEREEEEALACLRAIVEAYGNPN
jgi:hypothetical protein